MHRMLIPRFYFLQGLSSPSPSSIWRVRVRSTLARLAMFCAPWTSTRRWPSARRWEPPRRRARRSWPSRSSCPSSARSRRRRTRDATRTSWSAWSCTTRTRTAWCSWLSCNTTCWLWVSTRGNLRQIEQELTRNPAFCPVSGERLTDEEVDSVFKDCMDEEDEDGMIPYAREYPSLVVPCGEISRVTPDLSDIYTFQNVNAISWIPFHVHSLLIRVSRVSNPIESKYPVTIYPTTWLHEFQNNSIP